MLRRLFARVLALAAMTGLLACNREPTQSAGPDRRSASGQGEPRGSGSTEDVDVPISVVLLRSKPWSGDLRTVERAAQQAWLDLDGTERTVSARTIEVAVPGVEGKVESYLLLAEPPLPRLQEQAIVVIAVAAPYAAPETARITDGALRALFEKHQAWIAIDLFRVSATQEDLSSQQKAAFYRAACALADRLLDQDSLMIYLPELRRGYAVSERTAKALRASEPLRALASTVEPIVEIGPDDPELKAAEAKARERLEEFIEAFRAGVGERHAVKVRLQEGDVSEVIWIRVLSIEGDTIRGAIANVPYRLKLEVGDVVEATLDDVHDWAYMAEDGSIVGAFTAEVLKRKTRGYKAAP